MIAASVSFNYFLQLFYPILFQCNRSLITNKSPESPTKCQVYAGTVLALELVKTGLYFFTVSFASISATFEAIS